jgi:hypothetical protein
MKQLCLAIALSVVAATTVRAQTPCHAENDGPIFDDNTSMGGPWVAVKFTLPAAISATRLEVFTGEALGTNTVALYAHDAAGNQPGVYLESAIWSMSSTNAWQGAVLNFPTFLAANQTYWFVWVPIGGAQASIDASLPGLGQVYRASFDNGQTWAGPFQDTINHWKFRIFGTCGGNPNPVVYCTAGTTANGCVASISATANPNVAHTTPCQISIASVEGQRTGIVFYGLSSFPQPWCSLGGGSSFLCVKTPTMRTGVHSSGGSLNQCDGTLSLDWNAFQLSHPGALGAPWVAGNKAFVQGWFRDPPSCKTTSLSNAVELTYQP